MIYNLHKLLKPALAIAEFIALFPVRGAISKDSSKLRLNWISIRFLYWFAVWILLLTNMCNTWKIVHFREPNGSLSAISNSTLLRWAAPPLFFYTLFLHLSFKWPRFVHYWEFVDERMMLKKPNRPLYNQIFFHKWIFLLLRLMFFLSGFLVTAVRVVQCISPPSALDFLLTVFHVRYPQMSSPNLFKYIVMVFLELCSTISWLCCNFLILDISLVLNDKFKIFNDHLESSREKFISEKFWFAMRKEYTRMCLLSDLTDTMLGPLILTMIAMETMDIILFIYLMLTYSYSLLSYGYFAIILVSHLSVDSVTLATMANLYDESRKPVKVLQELPTAYYCVEARRFHVQLKRHAIALSGCKFFVVTQTAILSIISTLITYEVLLVQLGNLKHEPESSSDSASSKSNSTQSYCSWIDNYLKEQS